MGERQNRLKCTIENEGYKNFRTSRKPLNPELTSFQSRISEFPQNVTARNDQRRNGGVDIQYPDLTSISYLLFFNIWMTLLVEEKKKNRRRNKADFTADMIIKKNREYDKYAKLKEKKKAVKH